MPRVSHQFAFETEYKPSPKPNSSSADDLSDLTSNSDDDISLLDEIEAQQLEEQLENQTINEEDFVLIKIPVKKKINYYVAKVLSKHCGELNVTYLKKRPFSSKFTLEESSIVYAASTEDIVLKLPPPTTPLGSTRQQCYLTFPVDFSSYNVQ
ncbi:hypothetical protein FQA39_LY08556 [Lamprigera yunnana]|nr:hypothetical protein FQA39_LY08556 [Lamprigera yunnana]